MYLDNIISWLKGKTGSCVLAGLEPEHLLIYHPDSSCIRMPVSNSQEWVAQHTQGQQYMSWKPQFLYHSRRIRE